MYLGKRLIFMYRISWSNPTPVGFVLNSAATYLFFNAPLCLFEPFLAAFSRRKGGAAVATLIPEVSSHSDRKNIFCRPRTADRTRFWDWTPIAIAEFAVESDSFFSTDRDITSPEYKPISFASEA